jgi:putative transferase (TIGR04331 family)
MEGKNFSESHLFNSYVYQQLLRYFPGINWKHFPSLGVEDLSKTNSSPCEFHAESKPKTRAKQLIKNSLRILFQSFKLKPEVFIVATWIPRINYFWMTILTRRVIFSSESQFSKIKSSHTEIETDRWLFAKEFDSNFIKACSEIIDRIAPLSLTTGFKNELHAIEEQGLNYYPEYVISNQHHCTGNDAQRIWFGVFGNANNQLNIIQHGGAYGCYESQWSAYTEMRISRVFMSWGWSALNPSVGTNVDVPALRLMTNKRKTGVRKRSDGGILFLLCPEPGYNSLFLPSQPYGPNEYLRYLHGILELMQSCNPSTTSKLSIRRQNQRNMLTSSFFSKFLPQVKQDDSTKLCFENWNLIVSTYNGTNSLESLLSGVPCVFYWDKNYSSFNKVSAPLFRRLQEVGVLHFSAESAKPILEMDNLSRKTWWSSSDVTEAVSNFLRFFGWTSGGNLGFSKILAKQINAKP